MVTAVFSVLVCITEGVLKKKSCSKISEIYVYSSHLKGYVMFIAEHLDDRTYP